jgi:hypothetical protein
MNRNSSTAEWLFNVQVIVSPFKHGTAIANISVFPLNIWREVRRAGSNQIKVYGHNVKVGVIYAAADLPPYTAGAMFEGTQIPIHRCQVSGYTRLETLHLF